MSRVDLEHFPTSPTAIRMMSRVSAIYDQSYIAKWLFEVMGVEVDAARLRYEELRLQAFPETVTWAISYWEQKYGIPINESLDLETRRKNLMARRSIRAPMNPARVEQILGDICGRKVTVTENVEPYGFQVTVGEGENSVDFDALIKQLKKIKPSHQHFVFIFEAKSTIHITPKGTAHRFPYILAGTRPQENTVGKGEHLVVKAEPEGEGYPFGYPMTGQERAGTLPQENIIGKSEMLSVETALTAEGYAFEYSMTGRHEAGTLPQENVEGKSASNGISAFAEAEATTFTYPLCGEEYD